MMDILITGAQIITLDPQRRIFSRGTVAIQGQEIAAVGPMEEMARKYSARQVIDASGKIIIPGLINCHMHLPQVLMRGVSDNVDVMGILTDYIWPIQGNYSQEDALLSARLGLLEMIKSGTTAFLSTGLHPRYGIAGIARAMIDSGIRGVISKYVMDTSGYATEDTALHPGMWEDGRESLQQAVDMIETWHGAGEGRIQGWFSPRSVGGVSVELFREISALAEEMGVGITAHWAEIQNNVDYTVEKYGMLPAEFAEHVGMMGENVTLAHGICFEDHELDLLAEYGTNICHCPVCNMKLAMGAAKVPAMLEKGVNVCLGNDGMIDNNTADMFREMRTALLLQRNTHGDPAFPTAAEALEMATLGGAKAILAKDRVGSIEAGKLADIVLIDAHKPHLQPIHDPLSAVVWAANGSDVDTVIINGQIVMKEREVLTLNEKRIMEEVNARREKILEQSNVSPQITWQAD